MKTRMSTRIFVVLIAVLSLLSVIAVSASAADSAFSVLSTAKYARTYTLNTSGRTIPYTSRSLSTRGTVTYGASSSSYIDNAADELYVYEVGTNNGKAWAYVSYPTSSRRVYAYIPLSSLTTAGVSGHAQAVSTGRFYCAKRQGNSLSSSYYVDKNDTVYLLARNGGQCQILYPTSSGWRIAFANTTDVDRYCKFASTTSTDNKNIVSNTELLLAAFRYDLSLDALSALASINTQYAERLKSDKNGTLVFLFEGVGVNASAAARKNAMCVVLQNGKIVYLNRESSTIPDLPFDPSKNEGTPMPTLKSGIYDFTTCNHRGSYAALNVSSAPVVRFYNKYSFYSSTSYGINVHKRSSDTISASRSWVNSAGCQVIGAANETDYLSFIKAVGIVSSWTTSVQTYTNSVSGKIIIDRTHAHDYLSDVGYSEQAIAMIG